MKKKIEIIVENSCEKCPYLRYSQENGFLICGKAEDDISTAGGDIFLSVLKHDVKHFSESSKIKIPTWCSLETVK